MDPMQRLKNARKNIGIVLYELTKRNGGDLEVCWDVLSPPKWKKEGQEEEREHLKYSWNDIWQKRDSILAKITKRRDEIEVLIKRLSKGPASDVDILSFVNLVGDFNEFTKVFEGFVEELRSYARQYSSIEKEKEKILRRIPQHLRQVYRLLKKVSADISEVSNITKQRTYSTWGAFLKKKIFPHKRFKRKEMLVGKNKVTIEIIYYPEIPDSFSIKSPFAEGKNFKEFTQEIIEHWITTGRPENKASLEKLLPLEDNDLIDAVLNLYLYTTSKLIENNPKLIRAHNTHIKMRLIKKTEGVLGSFNTTDSTSNILYFRASVNIPEVAGTIHTLLGFRSPHISQVLYETLLHELTHAYDSAKTEGAEAEELLKTTISGVVAPATHELAKIFDSLRAEGVAIASQKFSGQLDRSIVPTIVFDYECPNIFRRLQELKKKFAKISKLVETNELRLSASRMYETGIVHEVATYMAITILLYKLRKDIRAFLCKNKSVPEAIEESIRSKGEFDLNQLREAHGWKYIQQDKIGLVYEPGEGLNVMLACKKEQIQQAVMGLTLMNTKKFFEAYWKAADYFAITSKPLGKEDIIAFNKENLKRTEHELRREGFL